MPVQTVIKTRRDTAATWTSTNPVLASGEPGLETDTGLVKFGDGSSTWAALPYMSTSRTSQIARNDTGASVTKGQVVYISGANGANALFSLADADTELTSSKTVGLLAQNLATNGIGAIVTEGLLSGVNTGTATAGQSVWLSSTAGQFVFGAPPAKPAHSVYLGVVTRVSATVGEILVKVQNGYELNELHDVNAGSPADNNLLAWDSATSMWINQTATEAGVATSASPTFTGTVVLPSTTSIGNVSAAELGYLDGVTSSIQTQLSEKSPSFNPTLTLQVSGTPTATAVYYAYTLYIADGGTPQTENEIIFVVADATAFSVGDTVTVAGMDFPQANLTAPIISISGQNISVPAVNGALPQYVNSYPLTASQLTKPGPLENFTVSPTEIAKLDGVILPIQTQFSNMQTLVNAKAPIDYPSLTGTLTAQAYTMKTPTGVPFSSSIKSASNYGIIFPGYQNEYDGLGYYPVNAYATHNGAANQRYIRNVIHSTSAANNSYGVDGDIWLQYTA